MSREKQNAEIYKPMCEELFNNLEKQYQEVFKVKAESEQIEEMARDICRVKQSCNDVCHPINSCRALKYAERFYNADYRKQKWISVDERLPETEGNYLVWNKEQKRIEIRFFYRLPPNYPVESHPEIREYFGNFLDYKRITHWMPLPEAPKMKGGAE